MISTGGNSKTMNIIYTGVNYDLITRRKRRIYCEMKRFDEPIGRKKSRFWLADCTVVNRDFTATQPASIIDKRR